MKSLNERQVELEADGGMTRRQATAYKLAGTAARDARFHEDTKLSPTSSAYSVLAIVWIHDVPHWRAAVTVTGPKGVVMPERASMLMQAAAYDAADKLLSGVGEGFAVTTKRHASFIATKPLTSSERAGLVVVPKNSVVVDVSGEADRELRTLD